MILYLKFNTYAVCIPNMIHLRRQALAEWPTATVLILS